MKDLWQHNRLALIAFVTVVCLAGFFGVKSVSQFVYWNDPEHQNQSLAGWMTPRYVAQSYRISPEAVQEAFGIGSERPPRRMTLDDIAAEKGLTMQEMQAQVDAAVIDLRAAFNRPDK